MKEKIRRIGGCKGRSSRVYLTFPPQGIKNLFLMERKERIFEKEIKRYTRAIDKNEKKYTRKNRDNGDLKEGSSVLDHSTQSDRFLCALCWYHSLIYLVEPDPNQEGLSLYLVL